MTSNSAPPDPRRRRTVFYAAVLVAVALAVVGLGELMSLAALGWLDAAALDEIYPGASVHRMHVLAQAAIAWPIAIGIMIQPWRSSRTFAAAIVALVVLAAYTVATAIAGVFDPLALIGIAALGVIVWAHPGRPSARILPLQHRRLLLGAPLMLGGLALGAQQLFVQLSAAAGEPHAAIGHYAFTAAMAVGLAAAAAVGSTSLHGRTLAAWLAVGGTLYYGLASIAFPAVASSLGVAGGGAAVASAAVCAFGVVTSGASVAESVTPKPRPQPLG